MKFILVLIFSLFFSVNAFAAKPAEIDFFWGLGCPHCAKEKLFLEKLRQKYPELIINSYEIYYSAENLARMQAVGRALQADVSGVPFTVVGQQYFSGYGGDETTGKAIEAAVAKIMINAPPENQPETIKVPILGNLAVKSLSLPLLTFILALLDGFNPCAMWTLLFLISLLLGMKDRKRMWLLGTAFIITSAAVYFLFMAAWLNFFLFVGLIVWVRLMIGLLALGAGGYYLRDYLINKTAACSVSGSEKKQQVFEKLRQITQKPNFLLALGGIILLAIAVNLVELLCSAGLPAIYTQVLSLSHLSSWQYYFYLGFYVLIFMLDDLLVFFTAMLTLRAVGIETKYAHLSRLIGGLLMFLIGVLLIFKPEWLMFG